MRTLEDNFGKLWKKPFYLLFAIFVIVWFCFTFISFLFPAEMIQISEFSSAVPLKRTADIVRYFNNNTSIPMTTTKNIFLHQLRKNASENLSGKKFKKYFNNMNITRSPASPRKIMDLNYIRQRIFKINLQQKVFNGQTFGSVGNHSLVIVIQVHNRPLYLKHLIKSLQDAQGISNVLLVFSHDFYSEEINELINSIDFCGVTQIFYPYSSQLFPNVFPGDDCQNVTSPMLHNQNSKLCMNTVNEDGRKPRDAKLVQLKHHWWWKANKAFSLKELKKYEGPVLFLEEDLYMVEDFIPTLRLMYRSLKESCPRCKIFSLAENQNAVNIYSADFYNSNEAIVTTQFSNMGLAFDRTTWKEMLACSKVFCQFNDYNWDFSLQHVFTACMQKTAAVTLSAPRLFHLGTCGIHFSSSDCDPSPKIAQIHQILTGQRTRLYPKELTVFNMEDHRRSDVSYGGWEDSRDQGLCLSNTIIS